MDGDGFGSETGVELVDSERLEPAMQTLEFTGSAGEYFKIWIVNVVLTLLTLGLYTPWAKVRTRRYFYLNTRLSGDPLDYLADPKRLLIGYLILAVFLVCYNYLPTINPLLSFPVIGVAMLGFPWVLYKSRRFFCRNSAFRNMRFRFHGTLQQSYGAYLGLPLLMMFTLGLGMPYALFRQKAYFFEHVGFGGVKSDFSGKPGFFFKLYYMAFAVIFALGFGLAMLLAMAMADGANTQANMGAALYFPIGIFYLLLFFGTFIITAIETNYCWNHTHFRSHAQFFCHLHPLRFAWIQISNVLVSALTGGLLIPWAKVRMMRYRVECMTVCLAPEVDQLLADYQEQDDGAFGDMAADEFDFEIGL